MAYLVLGVRVVLGLILLAAGVLKAHDGPTVTAISIAGYRILPSQAIAPLAIGLPFFEIMLGAYLVGGLFTRAAAWVAALQFAIFAFAVSSLVLRHIRADCGCFGSGVATPPSWGHVALDVGLGLAAVFVAVRAPGAFAVDLRLRSTA
jgi:uncharacterized membrane protein YphA (DoxX/SURF4 family)